jgi:uncharacterized membrane protein
MDHSQVKSSSLPAWWRATTTILILVGLALSAYLSVNSIIGAKAIGCGGGSSCDTVLSSRWSSIGGVLPVSGLAAGAYLAMLIASFFIGSDTEASVRKLAWRAMQVVVGSAFGSALWFIIVQRWIVKAFCPYCMATHIAGILLTFLVLWKSPRQFEDQPIPAGSAPKRAVGPLPPALFGLVLACVMAACQIIIVPAPTYLAGEVQQLPNVPKKVDPAAAPLVGSPDAKWVITLFFDHRCPHCQKVHTMLDDVIRIYKGNLAFVLRPAPLNTQCNRYIGRDRAEFKDSCDLAKLGLAIWLVDPKAFAAFDNWWFTPEPDQLWRPRSLEAAIAKAVELVGQSKLDAARADPLVELIMKNSIDIYGATVDQTGNSLPRLVYGTRWISPEPNTAEELVSMLQESLALPKP